MSATRRGQLVLCLFLALFLAGTATASGRDAAGTSSQIESVGDLGLASRFQDSFGGHFKRGRTMLAADFDLDGRTDFFVGNPGDESLILLNKEGEGGVPRFQMGPLLMQGDLAWGGAVLDYDNDGDYDLFVTIGGSEGPGFDHLYRNLWLENGGTTLAFEDVSQAAGIAGPIPAGFTSPIPVASANAVAVDYNQDALTDIFVNVTIHPFSPPELLGRNIMWKNNGDGTFSDVTEITGLGASLRPTRHSTFFDFDNDGDYDLYENNYPESNILWRNNLVESGRERFVDVTARYSPPGQDLSYPWQSFDSAAADFNNDGWEDLLVLMRGTGPEEGSPYGQGHVLFLNNAGTGFTNVAEEIALNQAYQLVGGAMGCQVGDINMDGTPDIYIGQGGPPFGQSSQLLLSSLDEGVFKDETAWIDFPAPEDGLLTYPPYPYRTHGVAIADVDGDGLPEIAVASGGPASLPDIVREPNRLYKFNWVTPPSYLTVHPMGDGVTVSRDAIGTRLEVKFRDASGATRSVFGTLNGGSCFSGQNGFNVNLGLGDAVAIRHLRITWPDGTQQTIQEGLALNSLVVVQKP